MSASSAKIAAMSVQHTATEPQPFSLQCAVCDRRGTPIDLGPARELLERIARTWDAQQIWLFGSRARGEASAASDWDFLAVVPDDASDSALDPLVSWRLKKESGVRADVVACRAHEFKEDQHTPNTLAYEAANRGVLVFER